jgi:long-chain acyl-CoA synthetase
MRKLERFENLVAMFFARAREKGDKPFLWHKSGGQWRPTSWADTARQVASLAAALTALGLKRGDRIMLVSENRPEFCITDLAIMAAGCITVPTYTTNTERDHQHIIENSGACAIIVSNTKLAKTLLPAALRASSARIVIGIDDVRAGQPGSMDFHDFRQLIATHCTDPDQAAAAATFGRGDTACIIYTSGTGGAPRGVMQHHGAILHNCEGCCSLISEDFGWNDEVFLSFLPLSHAYEHTGGQHFPIALGAEIYYSEGLEKLASNIEEVRPTIMVVVPRLFEVLRTRITKQVEKQGKFANYLLDRAVSIGNRKAAGGGRVIDMPMDLFLNATLRPKLAKRFGGRIKAMVSGGAPLNPEIGTFFESLGLTFLQGYGQTESGPVVSCNRPKAGLKMDTVGPPLEGVEVRIASDGEILVRGELVMHGYWRNEEETARVLKDGWLATGDVGHFDEKGRIVITDRKKDILVNDKGDNVSPQRIEGMLTLQPEIAQAMVFGDRRPHLVALLVPEPEFTGKPDLQARLQKTVDRVNAELSVIERVRRFILADEGFTIENEQLTPSLKIRRHVIGGVYGERLDALYKR